MATEPPRRRRHSPAVYRRRRIVLVVGILVIVAVVWLLIAQPWRGAASEGSPPSATKTQDAATALPIPSGSPAPSPAPSATPSATPVDAEEGDPAADADEPGGGPSPSITPVAEACLPRDMTVEAVTDQPTYASGQNPQLTIRLTNGGTTDCTLNVGTSTQVFTITSGSDTWWRSTDCQSEPSDMVVLLAAGQTVSSAAPLAWDRTRSSVDTCTDSDRPRAPGGGSSYHVMVEIGGIASTESAQILLY